MAIFIDAAAYLRIDALQPFGTTASGSSFATSTGDILEVTCYGPGIFRVRIGPNTRPDYGIVTGRAKACTVTHARDGLSTFTAGDATLDIGGSPLRFRLSWQGKPVFGSITDQHFRGWTRLPAFGRLRSAAQWTAAFALDSGEAVYGLGEKFGALDKRGQLVHSQVDDALGVNTSLAYKSTPFAWGPGSGNGAWGVFVHTPGMVSHGVGHADWSHRSYAVVVEDEALDIFLFAGATPAAIIEGYTAITGRAPAVPRWSLGLWVSRDFYESPQHALDVATKLRERRIPCDVLNLDARAAWKSATQFDFALDAGRYPDPVAALGAIKAQNLRICVAEAPYVSVHSPLFQQMAQRGLLLAGDDGSACIFSWNVDPATSPFGAAMTAPAECGIVDFTNPAAFDFWRDAHAPLFAAGVDVINSVFGEHVPDDAVAHNGDRGHRLHNVYPLLYNKCVYEATAKFQPRTDAPPMLWGRAGWAGSQRYPIGWGGDPQSDWEGLAASVRGALSLGLSGTPFHATDIGGYYGSAQPSPELYLRWLQVAVFSSHMRVHGIGEREPWAFGAQAEAIARKWLAFRYRLIPYLETVIAEATRTGAPVMRAMPYAFADSALLRAFDAQFMCGDALLVAPVIHEGGAVDIALPPGAWYDLNTRQRYAGNQVLRYTAPLDQFPVFGREGYALALGKAVQHTGEIDADHPLEMLWVFGAPTRPLEGFAQARISVDAADAGVHAAKAVAVQVFGDPANVRIHAP
ncbi:MAG: TIM-barrel domain-containing protein [Betaproteobacteria bacterium]